MQMQVIGVVMRRFERFDLFHERWRHNATEQWTDVEVYRTKDGAIVCGRHNGRRPGLVKFLAERGITPELADQNSTVCTVGKGTDGKWYGWSHRAICGFGIGDKIFEEDFGDDNTPIAQHGRFSVLGEADARRAAVEFARSVS